MLPMQGGLGSIPDWGTKIPHATTKPTSCNYRVHVPQRAHALPLERSPHTTTREACLLQQKACMPQQPRLYFYFSYETISANLSRSMSMLVNNCREAFGENKVLFSLFSGDSDGKDSACNAGDWRLIPGLGRSPGEGNWQPTPVFLPGEFPGQRSLTDYSPWGSQRVRHD